MPSFRSFFNRSPSDETEQTNARDKRTRLKDMQSDVRTANDNEAKSRFTDFLERAENRGGVLGAIAGGLRRIFSNKPADAPQPETAKPPSGRDVQQALEKDIDATRARLRGLASDLASGKITTSEFEESMKGEIVAQQVRASILGAGGAANMSENTADLTKEAVRSQLEYLARFIDEIEERGVESRNVARAGQYAGAGRVTATQVERQAIADRGDEEDAIVEERRVLQPAEHCPDCIEYAERGWQPLGSLPPIGDSRCGHNCKCKFEYRTTQITRERRDVL